MNRGNKANDNQCLLTIKCLLKLTLEDNDIFEFFRRIPSSNYLFKHLDDLLSWYVQQYIVESKRYFYHTFPRDAQADETKKLLDEYQEKVILNINLRLQTSKDQSVITLLESQSK